MQTRQQKQANSHANHEIRFEQLSVLDIFFKTLYFYLDKAEDMMAFTKRLISFGGDKLLAQGLRFFSSLSNSIFNFLTGAGFRNGSMTPAGRLLGDVFERLVSNIGTLSIIVTGFQGIFLIGKAIYSLALSKDDKYTRTLQVLGGIAAIGLTTLSILVFAGVVSIASPLLIVAGSARGLAEHSLVGMVAIYNRFFKKRSTIVQEKIAQLEKVILANQGSKRDLSNLARLRQEQQDGFAENRIDKLKRLILTNRGSKNDLMELTDLINTQREGNEKILNKVQGSLISTGMLVSAALMLTPLAPAATIALIAFTAFALGDAILGATTKQNSIRWLARGVNALAGLALGKPPFNLEVKTQARVLADLQAVAPKRIVLKADDNKKAEQDILNELEKRSGHSLRLIDEYKPAHAAIQEKTMERPQPTPLKQAVSHSRKDKEKKEHVLSSSTSHLLIEMANEEKQKPEEGQAPQEKASSLAVVAHTPTPRPSFTPQYTAPKTRLPSLSSLGAYFSNMFYRNVMQTAAKTIYSPHCATNALVSQLSPLPRIGDTPTRSDLDASDNSQQPGPRFT